MENIFVEFLPPWIETGLQPAFYDKESGTVLQQTARMYARVNMLIRMFNKLSKQTKTEITNFEGSTTETVNEYINKFNELHDYVHDYFDNLDVQEEINKKLDEMAEDGQLTQLIAQFLSLNAIMSFQNVASMKTAENLVNGSTVETYGFYNVNDGGGAKYLVRTVTNDDVVDEKTIIELYDDYLIAELIKEDSMNVKQFGAKGDGSNDDTLAIQTALDYSKNIEVPSGTYMVNAITHININSGNRLLLSNDATIKAITTSQDSYAVILCNNVDDVEICGGTIEGDRLSHTGETGEWGNCISITGGSNNINIHDIKLVNAWGDGLYIGSGLNVSTSNIKIDNCRRNGISFISIDGFTGNDILITNISGTAPEAGIDFEPNINNEKLKNIHINNLTTSNCSAMGLLFALSNLDQTSNPIEIIINNFTDYSSPDGVRMSKNSNVSGRISLDNISLYDNNVNPIALRNYTWGANIKTEFKNIYIQRTTADGTNQDYAAIRAYGANTPIGGIVFSNIQIYQSGVASGVPDAYLLNTKGITIDKPIHKTNLYTITGIEDFHLSDPLHTFSLISGAASGGVGTYDPCTQRTKDTTATSDSSVSISANTPIGWYCEFNNLNMTRTYTVQLPADTYCTAFSSTAAVGLVLSPGASLTLEKMDDTHYIAKAYSGTITPTSS